MSLCQPIIWSMAAMLRDSVVVVRTRPRAIPLDMITMRKSTHGFPFVSHIWDAYGAPLGGPKLDLHYNYVFMQTTISARVHSITSNPHEWIIWLINFVSRNVVFIHSCKYQLLNKFDLQLLCTCLPDSTLITAQTSKVPVQIMEKYKSYKNTLQCTCSCQAL